MTISSEKDERIKYLKDISCSYRLNGTHYATVELRSKLGILMERLKDCDDITNDQNKPYDNTKLILKEIFDIINDTSINLENFYDQYKNYHIILKDRDNKIDKYNSKRIRKVFCFLKKGKISNLSDSNKNIWGSSRQFLFGKIVIDELNKEYKLNLHPIFGCLLSPTGGVTGPSNFFLFRTLINLPLIIHTVIHDAAGYLYINHNLGPSYCYLDHSCGLLPKSSPLNLVFGGIRFWKKFIKEKVQEQ